MGHVEPGGEIAAASAEALSTEHPVWPLWRELKKPFAVWSAAGDALSSPGSWGYVGNDFVSGLRRNASTERSFALLDAAPDLYEAARALAALNVRRHEQMFQFVVLLYVSIPVTIVLGLAEVMPEGLVAEFTRQAVPIAIFVGGCTFGVIAYLTGVWRARQLVSVLDLWKLERSAPDGGVKRVPARARAPQGRSRAHPR